MKSRASRERTLAEPCPSRFRREEEGSSLVIAIFALLALSAVGLMLSLTVAEDTQIAKNHVEMVQCLYIAEAGLGYALGKLSEDSLWTGLAYPGRNVGAGYFTVSVSDSSSDGVPLTSGQKRINIKANIRNSEREVEVIVQ